MNDQRRVMTAFTRKLRSFRRTTGMSVNSTTQRLLKINISTAAQNEKLAADSKNVLVF